MTDDVMAYVRCGLYGEILPYFPAAVIPGVVLKHACSWKELEVISREGAGDRAELQCRILYTERRNDFIGFCRARNAVIEAAVLATRIPMYDRKEAEEKLHQFMEIVEKTGGENEMRAMKLVFDHVRKIESSVKRKPYSGSMGMSEERGDHD